MLGNNLLKTSAIADAGAGAATTTVWLIIIMEADKEIRLLATDPF